MKLYIFVEGKTDIQFFERILNREINKKFDEFKCIAYVENKFNERATIKRIIKNKNNNFIFYPDLDDKFSKKKIQDKKKEVAKNYFNIGSPKSKDKKYIKKNKKLKDDKLIKLSDIENKMFVIVQMIESWYLAGFDKNFCNNKNIDFIQETEDITKGTFSKIAKTLNKDKIEFKEMLLANSENFSITEACNRNNSFDKFCMAVLQ